MAASKWVSVARGSMAAERGESGVGRSGCARVQLSASEAKSAVAANRMGESVRGLSAQGQRAYGRSHTGIEPADRGESRVSTGFEDRARHQLGK